MTSACMARRDMVSSFDGDEKEAFAVRALSRTTGPLPIRAGLLRLTAGQTLGRRVLHSIRAQVTPVCACAGEREALTCSSAEWKDG